MYNYYITIILKYYNSKSLFNSIGVYALDLIKSKSFIITIININITILEYKCAPITSNNIINNINIFNSGVIIKYSILDVIRINQFYIIIFIVVHKDNNLYVISKYVFS